MRGGPSLGVSTSDDTSTPLRIAAPIEEMACVSPSSTPPTIPAAPPPAAAAMSPPEAAPIAAPPAEARVLLRRMSFGLTGLPPSPEEVALFEQAHAADPRAAVAAAAAATASTSGACRRAERDGWGGSAWARALRLLRCRWYLLLGLSFFLFKTF